MTESTLISPCLGGIKVTQGRKELKIALLPGRNIYYITYCNNPVSLRDLEFSVKLECLEKDINKVIDFINDLYGEKFPKNEELKV